MSIDKTPAIAVIDLINRSHDIQGYKGAHYSLYVKKGQLKLVGPNNDIQSLGENSTSYADGIAMSDISDIIATNNLQELDLPNVYPSLPHTPIHPSILFFPSSWNGFKYWLAFTPYPNSNSIYENPCIVGSNDLISWSSPVSNPLVENPGNGAYNADTRLVISPDQTTLYVIYRERGVAGKNVLKYVSSTNGRIWSSPVAIISGTTGVQDYASPSIWHDGTNWVMIAHNLDGSTPFPIQRYTAPSINGPWSLTGTVAISANASYTWWHSDFQRLPSGQIVGLLQESPAVGAGQGKLYLVDSADGGVTFNTPKQILIDAHFYKSGFFVAKDTEGVFIHILASSSSLSKIFSIPLKTDRVKEKRLLNQWLLSNFTNEATNTDALALDSFNRTDSATIGTSASGLTWTTWQGVAAILNKKAYFTTSGKIVVNANTHKYIVSVQFILPVPSTQAWLIFRGSSSTAFWRIGISSGTALILQKISGGTVASAVTVGTILDGDIISIHNTESLFKIFVNNRYLTTIVDNYLGTGTFVGIGCNSGESTMGFRKFLVEAI